MESGGGDPIAALSVGGSHVSAALVLPGSWRIAGEAVQRRDLSASYDADALLRELTACARAIGAERGTHWVVAMPGPFDYARGIGRYAGVGKFDALNGVDVGTALYASLDHAAASITFCNDADAFLLGEHAQMDHRQRCGRAVGLTFGSGIGSAFLADDRIVSTGRGVFPEAEAHLLTIADQPLEETVSSRAISRRYAERTGNTYEVRKIARVAAQGDRVAAGVLTDAFSLLGRTIAPWLADFGANLLVVGGSISKSWDLIEPALRTGLSAAPELAHELSIRVSAGHEKAELIGAAWHAHQLR